MQFVGGELLMTAGTITITLTIAPIPIQPANVPFTVTCSHSLSSPSWINGITVLNDSGNAVVPTDMQVVETPSTVTFGHPGLPAGSYTVVVRDSITGSAVTSTSAS